MLQDTEWVYSDVTVKYVEPVEGPQVLTITKVEYEEDSFRYIIHLKSQHNHALMTCKYKIKKYNENTGKYDDNDSARRALVSLKRALYGPEANGIPHYDNIVGCAVIGNVKLNEFNGRTYPNIFNYKPVPEDIAILFGNPEQWCAPGVLGEDVLPLYNPDEEEDETVDEAEEE